MLTVPKDLVDGTNQICQSVDLGLVGMHIIEKNFVGKNKASTPEWFWSTFEHVSNAPLAKQACDPADAGNCPFVTAKSSECAADEDSNNAYSYYNKDCTDCTTNQPPKASSTLPKFRWNQKEPYAKQYMTSNKFGTQVSRCWKVYTLTDMLNQSWRTELSKINSVFQNYMLVGTQWGAKIAESRPPQPESVVPSFLSNTVIETYLQNAFAEGNGPVSGSCITCHRSARFPPDGCVYKDRPTNLSFLPNLVKQPDQFCH